MPRCPQCNNPYPSAANFCISCGQALREEKTNEISQLRTEKKELEKKNKSYKSKIKGLEYQLSKIEQNRKTLNETLAAKTSEATIQINRITDKNNKLEKQRKVILISSGIILFVVFIAFEITLLSKSSKNSTLQQQIEHTKTEIIQPLQAEHNFVPQRYTSIVDRCYFYDNNFNRTNSYIYYGDTVTIIRIKDNFAYGIYDKQTFGWLRLSDIKLKK
ncbi:MAG: zinc ribbon domain-containing protein [Bacteroidales bacterium]|jgi:hypothetical protein|nr:zinc ribbon domain-containing protein [Bacteroidales bacterium]